MYRGVLPRAISRSRCALIHTFVFRLPRFYGNTVRTRLLIAARITPINALDKRNNRSPVYSVDYDRDVSLINADEVSDAYFQLSSRV